VSVEKVSRSQLISEISVWQCEVMVSARSESKNVSSSRKISLQILQKTNISLGSEIPGPAKAISGHYLAQEWSQRELLN
jgi:hypothetical protein